MRFLLRKRSYESFCSLLSGCNQHRFTISFQAQNYFTFADVAIEQKLYSKAIFKENSYYFRRPCLYFQLSEKLIYCPGCRQKKIILLFVGSIVYFLKFL